jgi:hypothetical protein
MGRRGKRILCFFAVVLFFCFVVLITHVDLLLQLAA